MAESFTHDPQAILDYHIDLTNWLPTGDTVASCSWTVPTGLTKESESNSTTVCSVWISGGAAGTTYTVTCHFVTSQGREDDRSIELECEER